jgi:hypothetical protein
MKVIFLKKSFHIFGYLNFFHNFDRILAIENLKKILDFSTFLVFILL